MHICSLACQARHPVSIDTCQPRFVGCQHFMLSRGACGYGSWEGFVLCVFFFLFSLSDISWYPGTLKSRPVPTCPLIETLPSGGRKKGNAPFRTWAPRNNSINILPASFLLLFCKSLLSSTLPVPLNQLITIKENMAHKTILCKSPQFNFCKTLNRKRGWN